MEYMKYMEDATVGSHVDEDQKNKWNLIPRFGVLKMVLIKILII